MKTLFKPLSKRNARFAAVVIGFLLIYGIISFIKDILSGMSFDELHSNIIILIFGAIIEYAMITISFSKDDPAEEAEKKEAQKLPDEASAEDASGLSDDEEELPPTEEDLALAELVDKYSADEEQNGQD